MAQSRPGELLTCHAVARLHGVSRQAVTRACREGRLPYVRFGHEYLIRREDAEGWRPRGGKFGR